MRYRKSKTLRGEEIFWIARKPKGSTVIARAKTEEDLDRILLAKSGKKAEKEEPKKEESLTAKKEKDGSKSTKDNYSLRYRKLKK
jgi:hypothetical protein